MDQIVIRGGAVLNGEVMVSGSKNAALPLLFATLLTPERCVLHQVPALADIETTLHVLRHLGARVARRPDGHAVIVEARTIRNRGALRPGEDDARLVPRPRAAVARFGHARGRRLRRLPRRAPVDRTSRGSRRWVRACDGGS